MNNITHLVYFSHPGVQKGCSCCSDDAVVKHVCLLALCGPPQSLLQDLKKTKYAHRAIDRFQLKV